MRYLVLVFSLLLVSCATPQKAPQSFYAGVYVPGKVKFTGQGRFVSSAGVFSGSDLPTARKAAYARFMLEAKNKGYQYFEVTQEKTVNGIGKTFRLFGKARKAPSYNGRTYRLNSIKTLLSGGKLVALKRPAPVKKKVAKRNSKPDAQPQANIVPANLVEEEAIGEPTVIMAPVDITGSVRKAKTTRSENVPTSTSTYVEIDRPNAVSDLPRGVVLRGY